MLMDDILHFIPYLALAYLIGSIPVGLLLGKLVGIGDIRNVGSGNIGATNMVRAGGKWLGLAVLLLDALKGVIPLLLTPVTHYEGLYIVGIAAVCGHCFPIWLRFHGGKGVATTLGVIAAAHLLLNPGEWWWLLIVAAIWIGTFLLTRIVSLASLFTFLTFPVLTYIFYDIWITPLLLTALIIMRHKGNIQRLIAGTEHAFSTGSS